MSRANLNGAESLAELTLLRIEQQEAAEPIGLRRAAREDHRQRVVSDLAGLRRHAPSMATRMDTCEIHNCEACTVGDGHEVKVCPRCECCCEGTVLWPCEDAEAYGTGLLRTAALYPGTQ
jgi:hypothetical protein